MRRIIFFIFIYLMSFTVYASFPVVSENVIIEEGSNLVNTTNIDPYNIVGRIALGCLALGGILIALQFIIDPYAFIAGYFIIGWIVASVGALLGLVWLFSRFKWGRKYWWVLLLGLFLIQILLE